MRSSWRTLLLASAVLLSAAGCGVSAGEQATSSPTTASSPGGSDATTSTTGSTDTTGTTSGDLSAAQQAMRDNVVATYKDLGFTDDEANCLGDGIVRLMQPGSGTPEGPALMDLINQCDIPMSRLAEIGQAAGGSSMEDGMRLGLKTSLEHEGLTAKQAGCVADAYVEKYGTDASAAADQSKLRPLFEGCDVSLEDLRPGG